MSSDKCILLFFAVFCFTEVMSFNIRKEGPGSYDFLLPMNGQGLALAPGPEKRSSTKHSLAETKNRIADAVMRILYDSSNFGGEEYDGMKKKRDSLFSDQKRQSMRTSNFDLLAGGGLGK